MSEEEQFNTKGKYIFLNLDINCCWCSNPIKWIQDNFSGIGTIEKGAVRLDLSDFYLCSICNTNLKIKIEELIDLSEEPKIKCEGKYRYLHPNCFDCEDFLQCRENRYDEVLKKVKFR